MKTKQKEEFVISGISGRYPESNCIDEFSFNLYNKVNMITDDERRFPKVFNGCPMSSGKLKNAELFDADFFNVTEYEANHMDAQIRAMLETTYEAICDSGTIPEALSGTKTGVFVGHHMDEGMVAYRDFTQLPSYKNFMSQTVANKLNLLGPTFSADAACASSLVALYEAFIALKNERCDKAIVIGVNISFNPGIQYKFFKLNMISPDSKCMCLDERANGYAKGEACVTLLLERKTVAKRIYAILVNIKTNNDGYKEEGITFPDWRQQNTVISKTYEESGINPKNIDYFEAHCTGTKAGDPVEMKAIYHSMIEGKERESPLLIGALKSNIGHTEGASGLCAITKVILSFENQLIPANLHFERANPNIESLIKGFIKPINENTVFNSDTVGVNNFGFGGSNTHAILRSPKIKEQKDNQIIADKYQRLIQMCGRNQMSLKYFFDKLFERPEKITKDLLHLINNISKTNPFKTGNGCQPMNYRGFVLINQNMNSVPKYQIKRVPENPKEVCFIFTGIHCKTVSKDLFNFDLIFKSIQKSSEILKKKDFDLIKILEENNFNSTLNSMVSLTAIQMALNDLLKELNVKPNYIIGYSSGEIVSAYSDGCIDREQALLMAYYCAKFAEEVKQINEFNTKLNKLKKEDLNKYFHQYYEEVVSNPEINSKIQKLLEELDLILKNKKFESNNWITNEKSESLFGQYFIDNLLFPMFYKNKLNSLPNNTIIVEISMDSFLEKEIQNQTYIPIMKRNSISLKSLGQLYSEGINVEIEKLYPKVLEPVSNGTRILSPFIKWDHSKTYRITKYPEFFNFFNSQQDQSYTIDFMDPNDLYIKDHCIDGKVLVPATAYLLIAWKTLAFHKKISFKEFSVEFSNVQILRATPIPNTGKVKLNTNFDQKTGRFDIIDNGTVVVSGKVFEIEELKPVFNEIKGKKSEIVFKSKDIYKTLRLRGYNYGPNFRLISEARELSDNYISTQIQWTDNFVTFSDCMLQTSILGTKTKQLLVPVSIDLIRCDPKVLFGTTDKELQVIYDKNLGICFTNGLEIRGVKASPLQRNINSNKPFLSCYEFKPFYGKFIYENEKNFLIYSKVCEQLIQNVKNKQKGFYLSSDISEIIDKIPEESKILYKTLLDLSDGKQYDYNLDTDLINGYFEDKNFFRNQLTIILENKSQFNKVFEVLEINESSKSLYSSVMNVIQYAFNIEYSLITNQMNENPNIKRFQMKNSIIGEEIGGKDLIIFKDQSLCLKEQPNYDLNILFQTFHEKLNTNSFLIVLLKEKQIFCQNFLKTKLNLENYENRRDFVVSEAVKHGFCLVSDISDCFSNHSLLFRKTPEIKVEKQIFFKFTNEYKDWFQELKNEMKEISNKSEAINIWLLSDSSNDGILGFVKCLRYEPNGHRIKSIQNMDGILDEELKKEIIKRDLLINVVKDGSVGHYVLNELSSEPELIKTKHCFMNLRQKGDLSSFQWFESQHKFGSENLIEIHFSALNFKDIMLATGRLIADPPSGDTECLIGFEFSGKDSNRNRVMGMVSSRALATTCVVTEKDFVWPVPDHWSLEDAATVPCVYATAYYALIIRGKLREKEKVLIHSGSGGVGQAAIRICLSLNCEVFVSIGTKAKKEFLKKLFPQLKEQNFCSSRDLTFKTKILKQTNGFGVDLVLNSLSEDKLFASLHCLANNGRFLEIGKYDLSKNSTLNISDLLKNKTFHSIQLDTLFAINDKSSKKMLKERQKIWEIMKEGIEKGVVVPINRTVFDKKSVEEAFRFMANGKHLGKVLIRIRDSLEPLELLAIPRTVFYREKSYLLIGGLGGMGLEIIDWMIERGARQFIVTSRTGPKDAYQLSKLENFRENGCDVRIWTKNILNLENCENLFEECLKMGKIGGIFHLSLVMSDGLFENQTIESFDRVFDSKSNSLVNLDLISRKKSLNLDFFVCFSSIVSSGGNAGQTNYGFTNSIMEKVCEKRRKDGLSGQSVQFGLVGDVGYVTENITTEDHVMSWFRTQRMFSCLQVLDRFLSTNITIGFSAVFNDSKKKSFEEKKSLLENVSHILGHKEFQKFEPKTRLSELGMDSLMSVEIKQLIERDFDLILSTQQIQNLTIESIKSIESKKQIQNQKIEVKEEMFQIPEQEITFLNDLKEGKLVFYLPPTDGSYNIFRTIARRMNRPIIGLNWTEECLKLETAKQTAKHFLDLIEKRFKTFDFDLIGYSFGVFIALEMSLILQKNFNKCPEFVALDMCPVQAKSDQLAANQFGSDEELLFSFLMDKISIETKEFQNILRDIPKTEKIERISKYFIEKSDKKFELKEIVFAIKSHLNKMRQMFGYYLDFENKFNGNVLLLRANEHLVRNQLIEQDYGFNQIITGKCLVHCFDGNHNKFMENNWKEISDIINNYLK